MLFSLKYRHCEMNKYKINSLLDNLCIAVLYTKSKIVLSLKLKRIFTHIHKESVICMTRSELCLL